MKKRILALFVLFMYFSGGFFPMDYKAEQKQATKIFPHKGNMVIHGCLFH